MNRPTGSGSLNQKISIVDRQSLLDDTNGSKVFNDDTVIAKKVWCNVKYIGTPSAGASEDREELQRTGKVKIEAKMRYREDIKHDDVVVFMGGLFDIYSIQERGRDEFIVIRAESRDDDTYQIAIADEQSEQFYLEYPYGVEDPAATEDGATRLLSGALIRYDDTISPIYIETSEIDDASLPFNSSDFYIELPIEWFNDYTKSGLINGDLNDLAVPAYVDDNTATLHDIWPDESVYNTFNGINVLAQTGRKRGGIRIPMPNSSSGESPCSISFDLKINPTYRCSLPIPYQLIDVSSIPYEGLNNSAYLSNLDDKMVCATYKKSYLNPIDYTGQETNPKLAYYTPVIAVRPYIGSNLYRTTYYNPSPFGSSTIDIQIGIGRFFSNTLDPQYLGYATINDVPVLKRGDVPWVDFRWGGIRRNYTAGSVKQYDSLNADFTRDFSTHQLVDDGLSVLDYWDVEIESGTVTGTSRVLLSLRYGNKMGALPYTVTESGGTTASFYPVNMHHINIADASNSTVRAQFYQHYTGSDYVATAPSGWDLRRAFDTTLYFDDYGFYRSPNVALEDLYIRIKNPRLIVNKLNLPDGYQDGDDLVYEEVEYKIDGYEIDPITGGFVSSSTAQNNHLNQFYVYDNIPGDVRDEKQATCVFKFDVEYRLKHFVEDDSLFMFSTNDRSFVSPPDSDQYFSTIQVQEEDTVNEFVLHGGMEAQNLFPFTVTHEVKVRDANG